MKKEFNHEYRPFRWFRKFRPLIAQLYGATCAMVYMDLEWAYTRFKYQKKLQPDKTFYYCVDYIANDTGVSYNTVCRALKILVETGLVERRRENQRKPYYFSLPNIGVWLEEDAEYKQGHPIIQFKDPTDDPDFIVDGEEE